jgi:purine-nucleoside phosphorylase
MSLHISAKKGAIAKTVLLPGDPLRAKFIATHYLNNAVCVSKTRNVLFYTGIYNKTPITVGASGMGVPSIGIYSYELYTHYEVDTIIRLGTCGAYQQALNLLDIINVTQAASETTFAKYAWGIEDEILNCQGNTFNKIAQSAIEHKVPLQSGIIHTSDVFYRKNTQIPKIAEKYSCLAVEMEAFALFANAHFLGKSAATLLTVSDIVGTSKQISAKQREQALLPMIELALKASLQ